MLIFTLFIQLTISSCKDEIRLLLTLGASPKQLKRFLMQQFFPTNIFIAFMALVILSGLQYWAYLFLKTQNAHISPFISSYTILGAIFILAFGTLLAGWLEGLVKNSIREFSPNSALVLGKLSSYMIMVLVLLAGLSELGIASEFIMILFVGLIGGLALALGLSVGLGSKELVQRVLMDWYQRSYQTEITPPSSQSAEKSASTKRKK